ncbi:FliH/SctL family protein [Aquabacterium sp. OR-4]|uniref:FliH/SctL family protein n=1 Tax=Aquabacterium sp. OR-4 TaxID=2978127 RepID=UPI0021B26B16|nr:flagellar assembly protein FliH [Aquabacterium sp. OR-4]MDT7836578.1 flagellar assembly protein FliH [Aquabacterium sp. OR-4]
MTSSEPGSGERGRERSFTRFIPREELEGVPVWTPGSLGESFDGGAAAPVQPMPWHPLPGQPADTVASTPLQAAARAAGVTLYPGQAARPAAAPAPAPRAAPAAPAAPAADAWPDAAAAEPDLVLDTDLPAAHGTPAAATTPRAGQADAETEAARQHGEASLAALQARLDTEVAAARQTGYQDGYRDGLVALDSFKSSYAQQVTAQVGQLLQTLDTELRQIEQSAAASVAQVAIALARQVVRNELSTHPALVVQVAQQAVATVMTGARQITVKVHPDDHALVAQGCAEALAACSARLVAEAGVDRGGCLVDTEAGGVDARIASRWAAVMQAMGSTTPWLSDDEPGADA